MFGRVLKTGKFVLAVRHKFRSNKRVDRSTAEWLTTQLQMMGPTYIKIGQFISSRRDIFDEKLVEAFRGLQDAVDPAPVEESTRIIKERLGAEMSKVESIESRPVACASIGQVHIGKMRTGQKIAIKLRRPGARDCLDMDITILSGILTLLEQLKTENISETRELLDDFKEWFEDEMDYTRELQNYRLLKQNATNSNMVMPEFYDRLCHDDFIVMSYVPSKKIRTAKLTMTMADRKRLAIELMDTFISQLVVNGVMHGDPHEGNIGMGGDGRIVLYDMGNVITVNKSTRTKLRQMLFEIVSGNYDDAIGIMRKVDLFEVRDDAKVRQLLEKYAEYIRSVDVKVFSNMSVDSNMRGDLPVKFNGTVFRIVRVFGLLEGICKDLDPEFSYEPVLTKYMQVVGGNGNDYLTYRVVSDIRKVARMVVERLEV
ncbi:hypothetical protein TSOC_011273 [Tetrabaena socialis]|uniref:ABC1 atypical kinase-like domain-containing protein n=1 Tax=Tetrabaena socialis TaxID=47790 RepID=A0A2J7ZR21_9CHLO|nr:hypothetical protein TSOC_011273 [Tetrabaena socialis]|eukprot:PNH02717.1 hypothetical protein TSOC_011273 [Tetrabaena socialis]